MHRRAIMRKALGWVDQMAKAESVDVQTLQIEVFDYATYCSLANGIDGLDFEWASAADTPDEAREKFKAFLGSECFQQIEALRVEITRRNAPADEVKSAGEKDDEKKA